MKYISIMKYVMISLIFSISLLTPENCIAKKSKKTIHWSNMIKATMLSGSSLYAAYCYYKNIIEPHVITLIKDKGLEYTIESNKKFVLNNPTLAALNAVPLFLAVFHAILARDYAKKIWKK